MEAILALISDIHQPKWSQRQGVQVIFLLEVPSH